jgi:hypothetical protein
MRLELGRAVWRRLAPLLFAFVVVFGFMREGVGGKVQAPLQGIVSLIKDRGAYVTAPPGKQVTYFSFEIEGRAAASMFEHLRAEAKVEGVSGRRKELGGVSCGAATDGKRYRCSFKLRVPEGTLIPVSQWKR